MVATNCSYVVTRVMAIYVAHSYICRFYILFWLDTSGILRTDTVALC